MGLTGSRVLEPDAELRLELGPDALAAQSAMRNAAHRPSPQQRPAHCATAAARLPVSGPRLAVE